MILDLVIAVVDGITGLVLLGGGVLGFRLVRRARRAARVEARRQALRIANGEARLQQHEELQRRRAVREEQGRGPKAAQAWQRSFDRLLAPAPACTSSEHNHVENYRIGSQRVERICVVRPPYSVGGITAQEAVQALQRLAVPQRVVLSPGERVLSRDEIESIGRQAEARARRGF